jgi:hypothetical protein
MGKIPWKINAISLLASLRFGICLKFMKEALMKSRKKYAAKLVNVKSSYSAGP